MKWISTYRRPGTLGLLLAAAAAALAAFGGAGSSHAASLAKHTAGGNSARRSNANDRRAHSTAKTASDSSTGLLDQWAACERTSGDSKQADPTVEHQVIYIAVQMGALSNWNPDDATAACGQYLAAARSAVAGGQPATHLGAGGAPAPGWGGNALYVQYANCMRANGYPTFPYSSGKIEPDGNESTNFNGTGIDPNSPAFLNGNANQTCGKQIGAPAWWINSWGPPGSVDVYPAGTNPNNPLPAAGPAALKQSTPSPKPSAGSPKPAQLATSPRPAS